VGVAMNFECYGVVMIEETERQHVSIYSCASMPNFIVFVKSAFYIGISDNLFVTVFGRGA
jgi:hypothetical protein